MRTGKIRWPIFIVNIFSLMFCVMIFLASDVKSASSRMTYRITRSIGTPWAGRLEHGVCFPGHFSGYTLRSPDHTYTTPEVISAILDAIYGVRSRFPGTCNLYLGDFSRPAGGPWYPTHKSHQNGRDVDVGMYARDNLPLSSFILMNEKNLDVEKTWCFIENLLKTGMVEKIFVDRAIQKLLFRYAMTQKYDYVYLDKLFGNCGNYRGHAMIQHEPGHRDHMHIRFYAPWSELAGRFGNILVKEVQIIAAAQQSFLPKKVLFYVQDPVSLKRLSSQLGVTLEELKRWNGLNDVKVLHPGTALMFYKRHFEIDAVRLAMSLDAEMVRSQPSTKMAMLQNDIVIDFIPERVEKENAARHENRKAISAASARSVRYSVKKGDTIYGIAQKHRVSVKALCAVNNISLKRPMIKPGQVLLVPAGRDGVARLEGNHIKNRGVRVHVVRSGDSLWRIARQNTVPMEKIIQANNLGKNQVLQPGMKIIIPH